LRIRFAGIEEGAAMRRTREVIAAILVCAALGLTPGLEWAKSSAGSGQVVDGATQTGRGGEHTAPGVGKTATNGGKPTGQRAERGGQGADAVGKRLHDSAKGFGDALFDGAKFVGRTIVGFFTGSRDKAGH